MAMSVGTCECGCGEFDHGVGGWEELEEHEHDRWQKHRCGPDCVSPCLIARCRESDGFWTWCLNCDLLCSGWFEEWSDEPNEEGVGLVESDYEARSDGGVLWPPLLGAKIRVDFAEQPLTVVEYVVLHGGDPVRASMLAADDSTGEVFACYAETNDGHEILIQSHDLAP